MKTIIKIAVVAALHSTLAAGAAMADAEFLGGKTVRIVTTGTPGGQSDQMARIFAEAINRLHPSANARVENMRKQGNVVALKEVYESGPKEIDITIISAGPIFKQITSNDLPYDLSKMPAIGSLAASNYMISIRNDANWSFDEDNYEQEQLKIGVHYQASSDYMISQLVNSQTNLDVLAVPGFETDVMVSTLLAGDFNAILMGSADPVAQNVPSDLKPLLLIGQSTTYPEYTNGTPRLREVVSPDADADIISVIENISDIGRILLAEPSISASEKAALEATFAALVASEQYIAENANIGVDISPKRGADVDALLDALLSKDSPVSAKLTRALACGENQAANRSGKCD